MASFSCEALIDAVQNEPSLWNTELNSNEEEKELAWKRISDLLSMTIDKLRLRWNNVRSSLAREIRNEKVDAKSGSGKKRRVSYKFTNRLSFLRPHMKLKTMIDNYGNPEEHENECNDMEDDMESITDVSVNVEDSITSESIRTSRTAGKTKSVKSGKQPNSNQPPFELKSVQEMASTATKVLNNICQKQTGNQQMDEDKDRAFCNLLNFKLKAIPDGDLKDDLQVEILQLISRYKRESARSAPQQISSTLPASGNFSCQSSWNMQDTQPWQHTQPWQSVPFGQGWNQQVTSGHAASASHLQDRYESVSGMAMQMPPAGVANENMPAQYTNI